MKRCLSLFIFLAFAFLGFSQYIEKIGGIEETSINKIGSVSKDLIGKIGTVPAPVLHKNCNEIKVNNPDATDGLYTIDPDGDGSGEPINCYCDMTTDGGGWTLVLLSNAGVSGCPRPYWDEVVNNVNLNGSLSSDITAFDLFLGVKYWNIMGNTARLDMGASPSSLSHRAYYDFSLDEGNNYALSMSNESVTIHTEGTEQPGMYTYHDGRQLTTRDSDHDAYSSNCSLNYHESAWWYASCWSGSFWGGGGEMFQDAPYWTGMGSEYFNYGSIWLR